MLVDVFKEEQSMKKRGDIRRTRSSLNTGARGGYDKPRLDNITGELTTIDTARVQSNRPWHDIQGSPCIMPIDNQEIALGRGASIMQFVELVCPSTALGLLAGGGSILEEVADVDEDPGPLVEDVSCRVNAGVNNMDWNVVDRNLSGDGENEGALAEVVILVRGHGASNLVVFGPAVEIRGYLDAPLEEECVHGLYCLRLSLSLRLRLHHIDKRRRGLVLCQDGSIDTVEEPSPADDDIVVVATDTLGLELNQTVNNLERLRSLGYNVTS